MPTTDVEGLDRRWAEETAQRVLPEIGARMFRTTRVRPGSAAAHALAAALVDAFNAGAQEWNTELQARLIESGLDLNLREGAKRSPSAAAAAPDPLRGRLARRLARRTSVSPATAGRAVALMVLMPLLVCVLAWLLLSGVPQTLVLIPCGLWLAVLALAHRP